MSHTYAQPPGRTRQQRDRKPRQRQQWDSEEQDMNPHGASARPSGHSFHHPRWPPQSIHKVPLRHESDPSQQQSSLQYHGSYYVKAPNSSKREAVSKIKQEEEAQYSAHQAKKRTQLSNTLSQLSPTKLGGMRLDDSDIATIREKQEKEARMAAKFESIRKREKREQYIAEQRQRENQVYEAKKQKAREQAERLEEKKKVEGEVQREEMRRARLLYFDKKK